MLTGTAVGVLGIIAAKPANPYAIYKIINHHRKETKSRVPSQTIYGIINMLKKEKLISGQKIKDEYSRDKTIYTITEKGKQLFQANMISALSTPEEARSNFTEVLLFLGYLETGKILEACIKYREKLKEQMEWQKKIYKQEKLKGLPYIGEIGLAYMSKLNKLNLHTVNDLIKAVENGARFDEDTMPYWRNEYTRETQ
jgi:DNA-binding PadR family transcriptional regulator